MLLYSKNDEATEVQVAFNSNTITYYLVYSRKYLQNVLNRLILRLQEGLFWFAITWRLKCFTYTHLHNNKTMISIQWSHQKHIFGWWVKNAQRFWSAWYNNHPKQLRPHSYVALQKSFNHLSDKTESLQESARSRTTFGKSASWGVKNWETNIEQCNLRLQNSYYWYFTSYNFCS